MPLTEKQRENLIAKAVQARNKRTKQLIQNFGHDVDSEKTEQASITLTFGNKFLTSAELDALDSEFMEGVRFILGAL